MKRIDEDLFARIRDKVAIVGIGHLPFSKDIGRPISDTAIEAIQMAIDDAGLENEDVDGMSMFEMEHTHEVTIARGLGVKNLQWWDKITYGGGASAATIMHAAAAIACGLAEVVVCHRARNRGSKAARPWAQERELVTDDKALHVPWGLIRPVDVIGMWAHRHMHQYGTTREHLGNVAIAARKHANRNPYAMMRDKPLDMKTYLEGRVIGYPLTLFDCCLETDGAVALVLTRSERAKDLRQKPVLIRGAAWGGGQTLYSNRIWDTNRTAAADMAPRLYAMAGVGPDDFDLAELYDCFTYSVLVQLEDYGFCKKGEGGPFVASGATARGGSMPVNTHGGFLSEAYVHGLNHVAEAVSQLRHTAGARQVPNAELALSTAQPGYVAGSTAAIVLRRGA